MCSLCLHVTCLLRLPLDARATARSQTGRGTGETMRWSWGEDGFAMYLKTVACWTERVCALLRTCASPRLCSHLREWMSPALVYSTVFGSCLCSFFFNIPRCLSSSLLVGKCKIIFQKRLPASCRRRQDSTSNHTHCLSLVPLQGGPCSSCLATARLTPLSGLRRLLETVGTSLCKRQVARGAFSGTVLGRRPKYRAIYKGRRPKKPALKSETCCFSGVLASASPVLPCWGFPGSVPAGFALCFWLVSGRGRRVPAPWMGGGTSG